MRFARLLLLMMVLLTSAGAFAAEGAKPATAPATPPFLISKETTLVMGPLRKDGTIDYVAAINEQLSKGVTKDNNAAIPLLGAVAEDGGRMTAHFAKIRAQLGIAKPPAAKNANALAEPQGNTFDDTLKGPWTARKAPQVAQYLDSIKDRLDLMVAASQRDHYYMPLVRERDDDPLVGVLLPHLNTMRQLCNDLKSRALLCLGNEDFNGFRRDVIAIVRLGRLNTYAPTLVENLVGTACEALGLDAVKIAATGGWLSEKDAAKLLADLRAAPARRPMYETFAGAERGFMLEFLQAAAVHGVAKARQMLDSMGAKNNTVFSTANVANKDWNAAMRKANAWYDRLADAGRKPAFADRIKAAGTVLQDVEALKSKYEGWKSIFEPIEDQLIVMVVPSMQRAYTTETRIAANEQLTQTALALLAFKAKLGEYPPKLQLLVPMYFKSEPIDPFTDKPLIYSVQGDAYELKSAGPSEPGQGRNDDLIIRAGN